MSLPIPLSVRLRTARADRNITNEVRDLSFRWSDPGGYASCQVSLDRPLHVEPDEIAYYGDLTVYDGRSGAVVWDGRLEDPGRSAGGQGQVWDIAAVGGQAHTRDRTVPYIMVDQPLSGLARDDNVTPGGTSTVGASPADPLGIRPSVVMQFPEGLTMVFQGRVTMRYEGLQASGQKLARIDYTWDAGRNDATCKTEALARTDGSLSSSDSARDDTWTTVGGGSSPRVIVTDWAVGRNTVEWRALFNGATGTNIPNDTYWTAVSALVVMATRYTAAGAEQLTAAPYTNSYVLASEVVADLLGRLLTQFDGTNATITTTTHQIDQLAYPDGVDPARVLADLLALESGMTWRAWERNADGKYRFEFVAVPASVRYEADVTDGYDSQGSADGLFNQVSVRWKDRLGGSQVTVRTATVPLLDAAGLTRQGQIDLGAEVGSAAAANRAGDQWLAERRYPANAGRLRIARPILDLQTGRMVMPWEIQPGLIRVRGVNPRPDALNATSRDGVTIFRIVSSEYRASDGAATLELDSHAPSTSRLLADTRRAVHLVRR